MICGISGCWCRFWRLTQGVSLISNLAVGGVVFDGSGVCGGLGDRDSVPALRSCWRCVGSTSGRQHFATIFALIQLSDVDRDDAVAGDLVGWSHDAWKTYDWSLYVMAGFLRGGQRYGVVCDAADGA